MEQEVTEIPNLLNLPKKTSESAAPGGMEDSVASCQREGSREY